MKLLLFQAKQFYWKSFSKTLDDAPEQDVAETVRDTVPEFVRTLLDKLDQRLNKTGYQVWQTPFGYFCEWELAVYGDSLAKVFKL